MLHRSRLARGLSLGLWVFAIAFVAMRMSGIHLHLCEDGQEPSASVHFLDGSLHHSEGDADEDHQDRDLSILGAAIFKKDNAGAALIPLLGALFLLLVLPHARSFASPARTIALPLGPQLHFTPPLRGPPL